jgi:hypothetical protein
MDVVVQADTAQVERFFKEAPRAFRASIADGLDHATRSFYSKFYEERLQGRPGIQHTHGGIFHRFRRAVKIDGKLVWIRQGAKQSKTSGMIEKSDNPMDMKIEMFTTSKVAGIHERGGVINGTAMPIPLNDEARAMAKSNMTLESLDLMKINGKLFLGRKRRFGPPELLFRIARSVRIQARLGFYQTWDAHEPRRDEIFSDALNKALEKI